MKKFALAMVLIVAMIVSTGSTFAATAGGVRIAEYQATGWTLFVDYDYSSHNITVFVETTKTIKAKEMSKWEFAEFVKQTQHQYRYCRNIDCNGVVNTLMDAVDSVQATETKQAIFKVANLTNDDIKYAPFDTDMANKNLIDQLKNCRASRNCLLKVDSDIVPNDMRITHTPASDEEIYQNLLNYIFGKVIKY